MQVRKGLAPWPVQGQVSKFAMCLHKQQPLSIVASPSTDKNCPVVLAIDQFRDAQISACDLLDTTVRGPPGAAPDANEEARGRGTSPVTGSGHRWQRPTLTLHPLGFDTHKHPERGMF